MAMADPGSTRELDALDNLISTQEATLLARTRRSHELRQEASVHLPGGVASSWQAPRPARSSSSGAPAHGSGTSTATSTSTSTAASGRRSPATATRRSSPRSALAPSPAPTSPSQCPTSSPSPRTLPPLRNAALALHQLWHRGDAGRRPPDARRDRATADHQGRGQLPRTPRRGTGVGVPGPRRRRPARTGHTRCPSTSPSRRAHGPSPTSCRSAGSTPSARPARSPRAGRGHDHRAGDDEHRRRPPRPAISRRSPACCAPTARS